MNHQIVGLSQMKCRLKIKEIQYLMMKDLEFALCVEKYTKYIQEKERILVVKVVAQSLEP